MQDDKPIILQLSSEQRWNLVQEGYNPLDPESVQRWLDNKPADKTLATAVAKVKKQSLGSRHQNDHRDYTAIGDPGGFDESKLEKKVSSRQQLNDMVNDSYTSSGGTNRIEERVRARISEAQLKEGTKSSENVGPIKQPRMLNENKQLITEAKDAANLGYRNGLAYLNAFIALLKNPSYASRHTMIEQLNKLVTTEDNILEEQLKYYRGGITKAEKELYAKIKG